MNPIDISVLIRSRYNSFTKTEQAVADYVLKYTEEIISMSITDLAINCNVGESSIFRFCKRLNLKGYQDFKIALVHSLKDNNDVPQLSKEIKMEDTLENLVEKLYNTTIHALNDTKQLVNYKDIHKTVDLFMKADKVYFFGVGASSITAQEAKNKFMKITNKTEYVLDPHNQTMVASLMKENDVAVIISYTGSTKDMIDLSETINQTKAPIVLITRFANSPLTNHSDITLLTGSNEGPLQGATMTAKISQLYLLDIIYTEYFRRTIDESTRNRETTAHSIIDKTL